MKKIVNWVVPGFAALFMASSAHAIIVWDQESADYYGIERPAHYQPESDCEILLEGPAEPVIGTEATYALKARWGNGVINPILGVHEWVYIYNANNELVQQVLAGTDVEGEQAYLAYRSDKAETHTLYIYDGESYDQYWADTDGDGWGDLMLGERWCEGTSTVTWQSATPVGSNAGKVTGGGWITANMYSFALTAQSDGATPPQGQVTYHDRQHKVKLHSTTLTGFTINGHQGTLTGTGMVNRQQVQFTVKFDDQGEPGNADHFEISWPGYSAGDVLSGGNLQVHQD